MKVTVDTAHDSSEDIQKAIQLLASLAGKSEVHTNVPAEPSNPLGDFMGMVETAEPAPQQKEPSIEFY